MIYNPMTRNLFGKRPDRHRVRVKKKMVSRKGWLVLGASTISSIKVRQSLHVYRRGDAEIFKEKKHQPAQLPCHRTINGRVKRYGGG